MRLPRLCFALLLTMLLTLLAPGVTWAADPPVVWTEFGSDGALWGRAVVERGQACPQLVADGAASPMHKRAAATDAFPVETCEAKLPANASQVTLAGKPIARAPATVHRIAVIGDTGCRIEGRTAQDCRDPAAWPFAAIAQGAASHKPDLVIHVGDYFYREDPCPARNTGCAGSPFGDKWATWKAEFFDPAAPLLAAAPWVVIRGNHEICKRGGHGWFRLLDPFPARNDCADRTPPYRVSVGGLSLLPFDDADSSDFLAPPDKVAAYGSQLAQVLANAPAHSWLITHRPIWALAQEKIVDLTINITMQQAIKGHVPAALDMVLSGHLHDFLSYDFGPDRPAQLVVGTGGDTLLKLGDSKIVGADIDGTLVRHAFAAQRFGYFIMDHNADGGWDGVLYAPDDTVLGRCRLAGRDLDCH